jgi:hypothetical protein
MKTETAYKIVSYIKEHKQATAKELASFLGVSPQALFRQLSALLKNDQIYKVGKPPKVFYFEKEKVSSVVVGDFLLEDATRDFIEKNFLIITPTGERKEGLEGFIFWCQKTKQPVEKTALEYIQTWKKYNAFKKDGLIDGMEKMRATFPNVYLDKLFYLDFYSIERFGKTKIGQLLVYSKQSQNKKLMAELVMSVKTRIEDVVKKYNIDGVGFVPPTVKREVQFMKELERNLQMNVKKISIVKIKTDIAVPQKTLGKLEDRIENAQSSMIVDEQGLYKNILLIDDAVGSGATFNETAKQIKRKGICQGKIVGLAITGSFKGFDVVSEV